jgi:hypothetical protein
VPKKAIALVPNWIGAGAAFGALFYWRSLLGLGADLKVIVKDSRSGAPLADAVVLVGTEDGKPFADNRKLTAKDGSVSFAAAALESNPPITVLKSGYTTASVFTKYGNVVEIALQAQPNERDFSFLEGKILGFPPGVGNRSLEVGLFLPAFRTESLLSFDPQQMISSYKVEIDVFGKRQVPGNIVLPAQDKKYMFFTIHLEKPTFIMPLPHGMEASMVGAVGNVPMGDAVDLMKNQDFLGVLNITTLTHVNWTAPVSVNGNMRFDITAQHALTQKSVISDFENVPQGLDALSVALFTPNGDGKDLVPMDVKSSKSEQMQGGKTRIQLAKMSQLKDNENVYIFSTVFDRRQFAPPAKDPADRAPIKRAFSAVLKKVEKAPTISLANNAFFKIIQTKSVSADKREYVFTSPNDSAKGLNADLQILNIYSLKKNDMTMGQTKKLLWSAVLPGNVERASLPKIVNGSVLPPPDTAKGEIFCWELVAIKRSTTAEPMSDLVNVQGNLQNLEYISSVTTQY